VSRSAPGGFSGYMLLQVPDILLAGLVLTLLNHWGYVSGGWAIGLFAGWIVKDVAMYPVLRQAFVRTRTGPEAYIGAHGVVTDSLAPVGYVRLDGELWRAQVLRPESRVPVGAPVVVRDIRGLTVLVDPETPDAGPPEGGESHAGRVGQHG
jgi:membrane protein implicated in regulation of membrane protease activity